MRKLLAGALLTKGIRGAWKLYRKAGGKKTQERLVAQMRKYHPPSTASLAKRMKDPNFKAIMKLQSKGYIAGDLSKLMKKKKDLKNLDRLLNYKYKKTQQLVSKALSPKTYHNTGGFIIGKSVDRSLL